MEAAQPGRIQRIRFFHRLIEQFRAKTGQLVHRLLINAIEYRADFRGSRLPGRIRVGTRAFAEFLPKANWASNAHPPRAARASKQAKPVLGHRQMANLPGDVRATRLRLPEPLRIIDVGQKAHRVLASEGNLLANQLQSRSRTCHSPDQRSRGNFIKTVGAQITEPGNNPQVAVIAGPDYRTSASDTRVATLPSQPFPPQVIPCNHLPIVYNPETMAERPSRSSSHDHQAYVCHLGCCRHVAGVHSLVCAGSRWRRNRSSS